MAEPGVVIMMIQCYKCAIWFHFDCVGLNPDEPIGMWPCPACRMMPSHINGMSNDVSQMLENNAEIKQCLNTIKQLVIALGDND